MPTTTSGGSTVQYVNEEGNPVTVVVTTLGEHGDVLEENDGHADEAVEVEEAETPVSPEPEVPEQPESPVEEVPTGAPPA